MNPAEIVFPDHPVQHSCLDTSTSKGDYIITFLESCVFLGKPSTLPGLLFIISQDVRQRSKASKASSEKIRIKQIILDLNREIHKLLEEANTTSVSKTRKEQINSDLLDIFEQLHQTEQALVLIG